MSLFLGSFGAIGAFNMKEFIAYSSISQVGFVFLGLIPANLVALASSFLFLFYYLTAMTAFFILVTFFTSENTSNFFFKNGSVAQQVKFFHVKQKKLLSRKKYTIFGNTSKDFFVLSFNSLRNFSKTPLVALTLSLIVINMAGLPPFPGFFSKFFILMTLVKSKYFFYAAAALVFNVLSVFYYLRILMLIWVDFLSNNKINKKTFKVGLLNSLFIFKN